MSEVILAVNRSEGAVSSWVWITETVRPARGCDLTTAERSRSESPSFEDYETVRVRNGRPVSERTAFNLVVATRLERGGNHLFVEFGVGAGGAGSMRG